MSDRDEISQRWFRAAHAPKVLRTRSKSRSGLVCCVILFGLGGLNGSALGAKPQASSTVQAVPSTTTANSIPKESTSSENLATAAIPDFDLIDLQNGKTVNLATLRTPNRAMLIWLWAPN